MPAPRRRTNPPNQTLATYAQKQRSRGKAKRSGRVRDLTILVPCGGCRSGGGGGCFSWQPRGWERMEKGRVYNGGSSGPFNSGRNPSDPVDGWIPWPSCSGRSRSVGGCSGDIWALRQLTDPGFLRGHDFGWGGWTGLFRFSGLK